jgi:hypothetical protein
VVILIVVVLALGGGAAAIVARTGSTSAASENAAALSYFADTPANLTWITVNNDAGLWAANGLSIPTSEGFLSHKAYLNATENLLFSCPLGSSSWADPTDAVGFDSSSISSEACVGRFPNQSSEVTAAINQGAVDQAFEQAGVSGASSVYKTQALPSTTTYEKIPDLPIDSTIAVEPGRIAVGGSSVPTGTIQSIAEGLASAVPLSSDPEVSELLSLWPRAISMVMGTNLGRPLSPGQYPASIRAEVDRLPAGPLFEGLAYLSGAPSDASVIAAATYPTTADAQAAVSVMGTLFQGDAPSFNTPYSKLLRVDTVSVHGSTMMMRLTSLHPGVMGDLLDELAFPLFWAPSS